MISLLIILPLLCALAAYCSQKRERAQRSALVGGALCHFLLTATLLVRPETAEFLAFAPDWLGCDELGRVFLLVTSILFLGVAVHTVRWLPWERGGKENAVNPDGVLPLRLFVPCLLIFLTTMTLVILARDFGLLWIAVEATTLFSAPLILFHRSRHSLEAMWKYLLICSVGIGLALFGTMMLAVSGKSAHLGLGFAELEAARDLLDPQWFKAGFICILAGYGTKMGLAPFHTWLPDAHSEAPGTVSALLSGALLNCSFLGILRFCAVSPETLMPFIHTLMTALGIFSLAVAAFFIVRQSDYKRMLAYSSVEHVGLLALFYASGILNTGLIHLCGHSMIKMSLFLIAGNILLACGTRCIADVSGLHCKMPHNAALWIAGVLMICGVPPSPLFYTEFMLLFQLTPVLAAVVLTLLFIIFAGMTGNALKMVMGDPGNAQIPAFLGRGGEKLCAIPFMMLLISLVCGGALLWSLCFEGGLL